MKKITIPLMEKQTIEINGVRYEISIKQIDKGLCACGKPVKSIKSKYATSACRQRVYLSKKRSRD